MNYPTTYIMHGVGFEGGMKRNESLLIPAISAMPASSASVVILTNNNVHRTGQSSTSFTQNVRGVNDFK